MQRATRAAFLGLGAGLAFLIASCAGRNDRLPETGATLEGTVKYGQEEVPFALVIAVGEGPAATGRIGEDGRYKLENCPLGEVKSTRKCFASLRRARRRRSTTRRIFLRKPCSRGMGRCRV